MTTTSTTTTTVPTTTAMRVMRVMRMFIVVILPVLESQLSLSVIHGKLQLWYVKLKNTDLLDLLKRYCKAHTILAIIVNFK